MSLVARYPLPTPEWIEGDAGARSAWSAPACSGTEAAASEASSNVTNGCERHPELTLDMFANHLERDGRDSLLELRELGEDVLPGPRRGGSA